MKVTATRKPEKFSKIELQITIESKEQLEMIYALFNFGPISDVVEDANVSCDDVRSAIAEACGRRPDYEFSFEKIRTAMKNYS